MIILILHEEFDPDSDKIRLRADSDNLKLNAQSGMPLFCW
jgi:hypothetical protein